MACRARDELSTACFDQGFAGGDAPSRYVGDESRNRIPIDHRLFVLRDFDDVVAERLGAAGRMRKPGNKINIDLFTRTPLFVVASAAANPPRLTKPAGA
jgi:hypothetical protein